MTMFKRYLHSILLALDQFANAIAFGDRDETISSRLGKIKAAHKGQIPWKHPLAKIIDRGLEWIDPGHSLDSIDPDPTVGDDAVIKHTHDERK